METIEPRKITKEKSHEIKKRIPREAQEEILRGLKTMCVFRTAFVISEEQNVKLRTTKPGRKGETGTNTQLTLCSNSDQNQ